MSTVQVVLDLNRRRVRIDDETFFHLTPTHYRILMALLETPGQPVSYREIAEQVGWGQGWSEDEVRDVLKVYVYRLRKAVGREVVTTVKGYGYALNPDLFPACPTCGRTT